jgi:hypothetical protein
MSLWAVRLLVAVVAEGAEVVEVEHPAGIDHAWHDVVDHIRNPAAAVLADGVRPHIEVADHRPLSAAGAV